MLRVRKAPCASANRTLVAGSSARHGEVSKRLKFSATTGRWLTWKKKVRPEVAANKKDQLEAKLIDLEWQHADCVDGSLQQELLADKIEALEEEINELEKT
jgi:hypothetical protein